MSVEVVVGVIGRAHGLRGEVAIEVRTDEPERRFAVGRHLRVEDTTSTLVVAGERQHSGRLLVRFAGHEDRTAAESLRGTRLVVDVDPNERPDDDEEFYDRQLVGLNAVTTAGARIGRVESVIHLPHHDLLEIATDGGARLVPFVSELVPEVDLAAGLVRIAEVDGLLSDQD